MLFIYCEPSSEDVAQIIPARSLVYLERMHQGVSPGSFGIFRRPCVWLMVYEGAFLGLTRQPRR
jgi:hypothetical protein